MSRYCFIADTTQWEEKVKHLYRKIDVTVTKLSSDEGCLVLNNKEHKKEFIRLNSKLHKINGISRPIFVPAWRSIAGAVPYITEDAYKLTNSSFRNTRTAAKILLSGTSEQALYAYDRQNKSSTYHANFAKDFKSLTGVNVDVIDFTQMKPQKKQEIKNRGSYTSVILDGVRVNILPFATPPTTVNSDGNILIGVKKADVVINSDVPIEGFKTVLVPGASWSSKWNTDSYKGRTFFDFELEDESTDEEEDDKFYTVEDSIASETSDMFYPDSASEDNQADGDDDDEDGRMGGGRMGGGGRMRYLPSDERVIVYDDTTPDFVNLSERELAYLPMSYVLSQTDQWRIVSNALSSKFVNKHELPRVSDYVIKLVADSISYSISKGNNPVSAAYAILKYAEKRGV